MPQTLFVPSTGTWSFSPATPPVTWTLPAGAKAGTVFMQATTTGSAPVNGTGVIFSVLFDGVLSYTSACMENGTDSVAVPPGVTTVSVSFVSGCHGGVTSTNASASAVSNP